MENLFSSCLWKDKPSKQSKQHLLKAAHVKALLGLLSALVSFFFFWQLSRKQPPALPALRTVVCCRWIKQCVHHHHHHHHTQVRDIVQYLHKFFRARIFSGSSMYKFENVSEILGLWVYFSLNMTPIDHGVCQFVFVAFFPHFFIYIMLEKNSYFSELSTNRNHVLFFLLRLISSSPRDLLNGSFSFFPLPAPPTVNCCV